MSSKEYLNLMREHPESREAFERLSELFIELGRDSNRLLPLPRMLNMLSLEPSPKTFTLIHALESDGFIHKVIQIESPAIGGIEKYNSLLDIPEYVDDFRTGMRLKVAPEHIKILYSISDKVELQGT